MTSILPSAARAFAGAFLVLTWTAPSEAVQRPLSRGRYVIKETTTFRDDANKIVIGTYRSEWTVNGRRSPKPRLYVAGRTYKRCTSVVGYVVSNEFEGCAYVPISRLSRPPKTARDLKGMSRQSYRGYMRKAARCLDKPSKWIKGYAAIAAPYRGHCPATGEAWETCAGPACSPRKLTCPFRLRHGSTRIYSAVPGMKGRTNAKKIPLSQVSSSTIDGGEVFVRYVTYDSTLVKDRTCTKDVTGCFALVLGHFGKLRWAFVPLADIEQASSDQHKCHPIETWKTKYGRFEALRHVRKGLSCRKGKGFTAKDRCRSQGSAIETSTLARLTGEPPDDEPIDCEDEADVCPAEPGAVEACRGEEPADDALCGYCTAADSECDPSSTSLDCPEQSPRIVGAITPVDPYPVDCEGRGEFAKSYGAVVARRLPIDGAREELELAFDLQGLRPETSYGVALWPAGVCLDIGQVDTGFRLVANSKGEVEEIIGISSAEFAGGSFEGARVVVVLAEEVAGNQLGTPRLATEAALQVPLACPTGEGVCQPVVAAQVEDELSPTVAVHHDGRFLAVWQEDLALDGIPLRGRLFSARGEPIGSVFSVDESPELRSSAHHPRAAASSVSDDFVVVWTTTNVPGSGGYEGVMARRFDSGGVPKGSAFQVNSNPAGAYAYYAEPAVVAQTEAGDFLVVWVNQYPVDALQRVVARGFDESGTPTTAEFPVNTEEFPHDSRPAVAYAGEGRFVVTWTNESGWPMAKRIRADGIAIDTEFRVTSGHSTDDYAYYGTATAADRDGRFIVAWHDGGSQIFAQTFDGTGSLEGAAFQVNTSSSAYHNYSGPVAVASGGPGDFLIVWTTPQSSPGALFARRITTNGPDGDEFQMSPDGFGYLGYGGIDVAGNVDGRFVVAWADYPSYDTRLDVAVRRLDEQCGPVPPTHSTTRVGAETHIR